MCLGFQSVFFNSGQKMALRALYVMIQLWSKMLSAPSFGRCCKQFIVNIYWTLFRNARHEWLILLNWIWTDVTISLRWYVIVPHCLGKPFFLLKIKVGVKIAQFFVRRFSKPLKSTSKSQLPDGVPVWPPSKLINQYRTTSVSANAYY